jgi:L-aminopeptidase/D-esterase-like protein
MVLRNLITDVPGILVGNADDARVASGTTVALFEEPAVAAVAILGGAPGSRDTALLEPEMTVERIDALVLSGGSAYGLEAAGGVMSSLAARGRGFAIGPARVPIVPSAILFDLANGGDKGFASGAGEPPYRRLGAEALAAAAADFGLGTVGAGYGALTVDLKGGLGSASALTRSGHVVGALVAVNGVGSTLIGAGPHFWAAPYEQNGEFGGRGWPASIAASALEPRYKGGPGANTNIAIVATDATLTKAQCKRLALAAHDGLARAIRPAHALLDGDTVFAAATGKKPLDDRIYGLTDLGLAAADCLARAVARGVYEARALPFAAARPAWRDRFK